MLKKSTLVGLALASITPAMAQQAAHVHGVASINLAIEGDELQIEFVSPADGIVGFEYEPSTAAERKAVADAIALLRDPDKLFALPASAGCSLHEVEVERHAEGEHDDHGHEEHAKHDDHEHDDHGHEDQAKHEDHDDHGHEEHAKHEDHEDHDHGKAEENHSEFHAHYHFDCKKPAIAEIALRLFDTWPRIEKVRVQALTPGGQTGGNIGASDPVIRLQ